MKVVDFIPIHEQRCVVSAIAFFVLIEKLYALYWQNLGRIHRHFLLYYENVFLTISLLET